MDIFDSWLLPFALGAVCIIPGLGITGQLITGLIAPSMSMESALSGIIWSSVTDTNASSGKETAAVSTSEDWLLDLIERKSFTLLLISWKCIVLITGLGIGYLLPIPKIPAISLFACIAIISLCSGLDRIKITLYWAICGGLLFWLTKAGVTFPVGILSICIFSIPNFKGRDTHTSSDGTIEANGGVELLLLSWISIVSVGIPGISHSVLCRFGNVRGTDGYLTMFCGEAMLEGIGLGLKANGISNGRSYLNQLSSVLAPRDLINIAFMILIFSISTYLIVNIFDVWFDDSFTNLCALALNIGLLVTWLNHYPLLLISCIGLGYLAHKLAISCDEPYLAYSLTFNAITIL